MYIAYSEEQEQLRRDLRAYYDELLTPQIREELHRGHGVGPTMRAVVKRMGADGWLGIGWPKEWGGQGRSQIEQFIFFDESMRAGAPVPMLTINTVGPTIMRHGTEEQKKFFLPRILKGEIHFCIGYTEPNAGTDLASLKTRAVRDGDEYVVNGQKIFTSLAGDSDYMWLAVRTNPDAPKHEGISMLAIDVKTPGLRIDPMHLLSEHDINTIFLDDVRVPASRLVGKENQGWRLITSQLNHERVTLCSAGLLAQAYEETVAWARANTTAEGDRVIDQEWVQVNLARVHAGLEFLRLINWKVAWAGTQGRLDVADASTIKVFGTEFYLESFRYLMEIIGPRAYLRRGSADAVGVGRLEMLYRSLLILTFGGGTNEVQRDLIGMFGLGLPRMPRFLIDIPETTMDFAFTDEQQAIADLAKQIFTDKASHERVRQIERADGPRFDRELWQEVAKAGLLGIAVPQSHGGAGLGFLEVALIVEQVARAAAPIPLLETIVLGALPLAEFGSAEQQAAWLPKIAQGKAIVTAALIEDQGDPTRPAATARKDGGTWRLSGTKTCVPAGDLADLVLVPATVDGKQPALFLIEASAPGFHVESLATTSGQPEARITLNDVRLGADAVLGDAAKGERILDWITERATTAQACVALGVCAQALVLTAEYTKNRKQFDQPIAMFQAVGQRLADAYVDVEAIRLTTWQAAWRLSAGMPAASQVAIAKFWASTGGQRVVHTAQHLHGGMGVDRDYPLHRYFLYAKQLELTLGGTTTQLRKLGRLIVADADRAAGAHAR